MHKYLLESHDDRFLQSQTSALPCFRPASMRGRKSVCLRKRVHVKTFTYTCDSHHAEPVSLSGLRKRMVDGLSGLVHMSTGIAYWPARSFDYSARLASMQNYFIKTEHFPAKNICVMWCKNVMKHFSQISVDFPLNLATRVHTKII